ncbi:hypothetical protein ACFL35_15060 [Candidatus Riflebacteria bacterium]
MKEFEKKKFLTHLKFLLLPALLFLFAYFIYLPDIRTQMHNLQEELKNIQNTNGKLGKKLVFLKNDKKAFDRATEDYKAKLKTFKTKKQSEIILQHLEKLATNNESVINRTNINFVNIAGDSSISRKLEYMDIKMDIDATYFSAKKFLLGIKRDIQSFSIKNLSLVARDSTNNLSMEISLRGLVQK